jgi:putative transposase
MYDYRKLTVEQREAVVEQRKRRGLPWHGPPHLQAPDEYRIVTGACYEHRKILSSTDRLAEFEKGLLDTLDEMATPCAAWVVLPNHYHVLVQIMDVKSFAKGLGQLHGSTSFRFNKEDNQRGRKVWYRCQDRVMRSERHYLASLNYIHNNPVKHNYVDKWQDWPFSSVHGYLESKGRDWLLSLWREFPVLNYGDTWNVF